MGEQVICVDGNLPKGGRWTGDPIIERQIYTIRGETMADNGEYGYLLYEAKCNVPFMNGNERCYRAARFRPVRKHSIEIFRQIAANPKTKIKEPA